jgi:hypothetical protein
MTSQSNLYHFSESFEEARSAFRQSVLDNGGELSAIPIGAEKLVSKEGEPLTIDIGIWRKEKKNAIVLSSGLHGVEGYCGSAIQRAAIEKYQAESQFDDLSLVCVHAINPYGMAHNRRVNENNVDLNRNFIEDADGFKGASEGYQNLYSLLNPDRPYGLRNLMFFPKALALIARHGMNTLKQAIVGGQYEYPKGLFWGGDQLQEGPTLLMNQFPQWLPHNQKFVHIDFHTGLGASGTYSLLVEYPSDHEHYHELKEAFGDSVQPWDAGAGVAYAISGGFPDAVQRKFGDSARFLTCEFGTHSPLKVITALQAENQAHHHGGDVKKAKAQIREAFFPSSSVWKESVLTGGLAVFDQARQFLTQDP